MAHRKQHAHAEYPPRSVAVHVVVVSTTRTLETDRSGPVIVAALEAAGHRVVSRELVPDDAAQIRSRLAAAVAGPHRVILFAGGTGISLRDGTFEAVDSALDKRLPGFGELFRMLSYKEIGPAAMLSRATAGVVGDTVVFAIPGSTGACRLAVEQLIAPELGHLLRELDKEKPAASMTLAGEATGGAASAAAAGAASDEAASGEAAGAELGEAAGGQRVTAARLRAEETAAAAAPSTAEPAAEGAAPAGWMRHLEQLGGALQRGRAPQLNPGVAAVPAAVNVLSTAGERAGVTIGDRDYLAFGFPDLLRPSARVLLISCEGSPFGEVLALHRWPGRTGVLMDEAGGVLGASGRLGRLAVEVTGRDYPESGRVLAVEGGAIYVVEHGTRVFRWDGSRRREEGLPRGVLASLLLQWSQR